MDDFEDSDLSALFAEVDQLEATRKASSDGPKVRHMFVCMHAHLVMVAAYKRDLGVRQGLTKGKHAFNACRILQQTMLGGPKCASPVRLQSQSCSGLPSLHKMTDLP